MASGSIEGGGSYLHAYIYWSSAKGTGGSTVAADLHAKNVDGAWYQANLYGGYNLTINGNTKSGSGAALSGSANGSVLILSHSVWVGYTGNKSVTISGWIGSNGIYVNGINIGNRDCSGTAKLDMVGSAPSVPVCTAPTAQIFTELGGTITVKWNKVSSYTESGAGYWVDIQINNGAWTNIATINNINTLTYNYTIPAGQGGTYRFRVGAFNPVGNAGNHGYSGVVTRNSLSAPTIGTLNTYNPYVTSTLSVPLSGGSQANGAAFKRYADLYYGTTLLAHCATPSDNNTSASITYSAANFITKLGSSKYSDTFKITAWCQNSNGSRSAYVSKEFTVNINTDGGATPTLGNPTLSGGILGQAATCFVTGVNSVIVTVPNATLRRAPSGTTVSYKIECTGATVAIGQTATFSGLSAGTKTIKVTAIDSRGLSVSTTIQCVVQPWSAPRITIESCERVSTNTTTAQLVYSMTYAPIYTYPTVSTQGTQLNSISLQQYNINGGSWNTASNNMTISGLSNELTYIINMRCADKVKTTTYSTAYITVPTINSLLSMRKWGCGINCIPQNGYALDVTGKARIGGNFVVGVGKETTSDGKNGIYLNADGSIELTGGTSYIDFHYGNSTENYNHRILSNTSGFNFYSDTGIHWYTGNSAKHAWIDSAGHMSIQGNINATGAITADKLLSSKNTSTWLNGANNGALVNSTASSGSYVALVKGNTTHGMMGISSYQNALNFWYVSKDNVDANNNKSTVAMYVYEDGRVGFTGKTQGFFPVGAVYISVTSTNPSTYFGGTWVQFGQGKTLVGVNTSDTDFNTVEKTGGEKTHKLTIDEMPSHSHAYKLAYGSNDPSKGFNYGNTPVGVFNGDFCQSAGGSQAHNNVQPYITVYFWKRTA